VVLVAPTAEGEAVTWRWRLVLVAVLLGVGCWAGWALRGPGPVAPAISPPTAAELARQGWVPARETEGLRAELAAAIAARVAGREAADRLERELQSARTAARRVTGTVRPGAAIVGPASPDVPRGTLPPAVGPSVAVAQPEPAQAPDVDLWGTCEVRQLGEWTGMTWSCAGEVRQGGLVWPFRRGPEPVRDLLAEVELPPTAAPWPRWDVRVGVGSDRALVLGGSWYPRRRGLRHVGLWAEYERSRVLPDGLAPWSAGTDDGVDEWDGRVNVGLAGRW